MLIWTTTPWTLPANVAVAVNPKIEYSKYKIGSDYIWSAVTPPYESDKEVRVVERASGKILEGLEYELLFRVPDEYSIGSKPSYRVYGADFVSVKEGTGMVHIAPAFGEEDLDLVKSLSTGDISKGDKIGYPILQTVNPDGTMKKGIVGEGKFVKDADKEVIEDLSRRGLLLKAAPYEHDYPFCWRCQTPLLYYAKTAWWVRVSVLKEKLLRNNEKINWIPEHIKHGRFGEFLREVRDWAFSRERFWGTPLPIWECKKCETRDVMGSRDELAERAGKQKNRYLIMRHGEALLNVEGVASYALDGRHKLTFRGRVQAERAAKKFKKEKVDFIFSSDLKRTEETAEIAASVLGIKKINFDARIREINTGIFEGRNKDEYHKFFSGMLEKFTKPPPEGETLTGVRKRMMEFLKELEKKYSGKTILIISHEYPLWMLYAGALGLSNEESAAIRAGKREHDFIGFAEVMELTYKNLPRDEDEDINLHRPYVDGFEVGCRKCGGVMRRVPEVVDVWFDSGAMPLAQGHWPFAQIQNPKSKIQKLSYPADYICEAVDQTRGWFYTLLATSTLLGKGTPYKNVISLGHVLDKYGQKMSKSKGNVVDPSQMIQKYGSDTLRWYFYTLNPPGEPKRFDEKDLGEGLRRFLMTFWNAFIFFDTYVEKISNFKLSISKFSNILDRWVLIRLQLLVSDVTRKLEAYDVTGAARDIENFVIGDFSQWYLRRSRRRFQRPESKEEKNEAAATTGYVLLSLCKISAPFVPFLAENIYRALQKKLKLKESSIHLTKWPVFSRVIPGQAKNLLKKMELARFSVKEALKLRAEAGIKVRQPLRELRITNYELRTEIELLLLIKDEVNVKEITFGEELRLDTTITPDLKEEGMIREVIRNLQEMRRDLGLEPKDRIKIQFSGKSEIIEALGRSKKFIMAHAGAVDLVLGGKKVFKAERELDFDGSELWVGIANVA